MSDFSPLAKLAEWGPQAPSHRPPSIEDAQAYCRLLALGHYENFPVVSWLLPRDLRQHFYNVYAYCRWADDLGDETGEPAEALKLLGWWRGELEACYRGEARHPVFVALRETIGQCSLPMAPFADLISAFEQDQQISEYETFAQLLDYCTRSANPVGRLVLMLCGQYSEERARLADSICTGLQLANFWQDVARDRDIGRLYLPREDRERFGYLREHWERRETNQAFLDLMAFEVRWARQFLHAGTPLIHQMPGKLRLDIDLFRRGGLEILRGVERIGYRVWDRRPRVSKWGLFFAGCSSIWCYATGRQI